MSPARPEVSLAMRGILTILALFACGLCHGAEALPKPEVPDPYGLGERLALIDYLRDEMHLEPAHGATVEELTTLYWQARKDAEAKDPEAAERADRIARMRSELNDRFSVQAPADASEDDLRTLLAAVKESAADQSLREVKERADSLEHPRNAEDAARIAEIDRGNVQATSERLAGDIRSERSTIESLDKKIAKIAADLAAAQAKRDALNGAVAQANAVRGQALSAYNNEMRANNKVSDATKKAYDQAEAEYKRSSSIYQEAAKAAESLQSSDADIVKQRERALKRIEQLDRQRAELASAKSAAPSLGGASSESTQAPAPVSDLESKLKAAVVLVLVEGHGSGTGFFVSSDGLLVTNAHVLADRELPTYALWDNSAKRQPTKLRLIKKDSAHDLALLRAESGAANFSPLALREVYDLSHPVMAVGFPLASMIAVELGTSPTDIVVSRGIIGAVRRQGEQAVWLQHDCKIASGNSGGPLVDQSTGDVVGVNTMVLSPDSAGAAGDSMSFAIPVAKIRETFGSLLK
jgi:S1-C subfamily serine protease